VLSPAARDGEALGYLLTAERAAPQLGAAQSGGAETVKALHRRAPVTGASKSSPLRGLAERCRSIQ